MPPATSTHQTGQNTRSERRSRASSQSTTIAAAKTAIKTIDWTLVSSARTIATNAIA